MDDSFDALPPYPGVPFPTSPTYENPASPEPPSPPPPRRWLMGAFGAGAVVLAAGAFLLGRGSAHPSTSTLPTATALSALTSATAAPANALCGTPRGATAGTLKSVSGGTLTVTTPRGSVTVKTDSNTKVTKVTKGALGDVSVGATVAVHGTANGTASIAADQVAVLPAGLKPLVGPRPGRGPAVGIRPAAAGIAVGTVQSVSGSGFTVMSGGSTITVTTSSSTAFSKTVQSTVSDLTTGQPVAVAGTRNSDGSITASNIEQAATGASVGKLPGFGVGPGRGHFPGAPAPTTTVPSGSSSGTG